jgi:NAD(P)-dependent dehydrogenase (short-subunit alcohol dehydrogenase family)
MSTSPLPDGLDWESLAGTLETLADEREHLSTVPQALRQRLLIAAGRLSRPDRDGMVRMAKAFRRQERAEAKAHDKALLESSGLRSQRRAEVYTPLWLEPPRDEPSGEASPPELNDARGCYVCKQPFRTIHFFYDSMCGPCGDFNYAKRRQTADLRGKVALVTGGRVKIGYQASLILLRAGAKVVVTTRFPNDAAHRYAGEPDFESFRDRLQVYGLDLRHSPSVELFARALCERESHLDVIINNACQTVRRPAGFYGHLLAREEAPVSALPEHERRVVGDFLALKASLTGRSIDPEPSGLMLTGVAPAAGLVNAPRLSQLRYIDDDFASGSMVFPDGRYDEDRQQVDLRDVNSWRLTLAEVTTPELLEVQLVNAVAPYILNARLKPLMLRGNAARDRHVVNVSAMEGQFYRAKKTDRHPHTNMAKAALNMMTRTSAPDYAKDGLWMNAVDTGWVTDEDPAVHAARKAELGFQPPLDIIDGAARIVDPYLVGQLTGQHAMGQFLKDYKPAPW